MCWFCDVLCCNVVVSCCIAKLYCKAVLHRKNFYKYVTIHVVLRTLTQGCSVSPSRCHGQSSEEFVRRSDGASGRAAAFGGRDAARPGYGAAAGGGRGRGSGGGQNVGTEKGFQSDVHARRYHGPICQRAREVQGQAEQATERDVHVPHAGERDDIFTTNSVGIQYIPHSMLLEIGWNYVRIHDEHLQ